MTVSGLICFGDSILAGLGASERSRACAKLLKDSLRVRTLLKGRNCDTSRDAIARIKKDVLENRDLSHVLILFGNNDAWPNAEGNGAVPIAEFRDNLEKMVSSIRQNRQIPILINLQPIDSEKFYNKFKTYLDLKKRGEDPLLWQKQYSDTVNAVAAKLDVPLIDIRSSMEAAIIELMSEDGIHPNDKGHRIIYQALLGYFSKIDPAILCP